MVSVTAGIYECTYLYCTGISAVVLYFSAIYTEACKGKKTGSLEYTAGEYDRISGIHISALFQTSDGFFQNDDIHLLLYEYFSGSTGTQSDQNGTSQDPEPGIQSEAYFADRIQPCCGTIY